MHLAFCSDLAEKPLLVLHLLVRAEGFAADLAGLVRASDGANLEGYEVEAAARALGRRGFLDVVRNGNGHRSGREVFAVPRELAEAVSVLLMEDRRGPRQVFTLEGHLGALPLSLREWGVHAAVGGALKWLCGGPGNCFLYVDPDAARGLEPAFTGWAAHKQPFLFSPRGQDYRDDGGRFATGTPNVPALCAGREGIGIVARAGLAAIRVRSQKLTKLVIEEAQRPVVEETGADEDGGRRERAAAQDDVARADDLAAADLDAGGAAVFDEDAVDGGAAADREVRARAHGGAQVAARGAHALAGDLVHRVGADAGGRGER